MKRLFDIIFSLIVLLTLLPIFIVVAVLIIVDSKGGIFFKQIRVGKNNVDFSLFKFRTMTVGSDKKGQITIGNKDSRITKVGSILRKYKLDEFPQLINILNGEMSIVGPRPEVRKYVELYTKEQLNVLSVKPGLTDYASLEYINESEILGNSEDPNQTYINEIMPLKLKLNLKYISKISFITDLSLIFKTIIRILAK
ncbi:MAG: sugar transferase [Flavobacteriales bacterium]|nr:sugar transferase [Flavobacteriales bacterium]